MNEEGRSEVNTEALIEKFKKAEKGRTVARRTITLTLILIVLSFVYMIWTAVGDFRDEGIPKFGAALSAEATDYMPEVSKRVQQMTDHLIPIYLDEFAKVYSRDEEKFAEIVADEFGKLEQSANANWPKMESAIAELVVAQEETARKSLEEIISEEEMIEVSMAYQKALVNYLQDFFETHFTEHIATGDEILVKLEQVAQTEPNMPPDNSQYILGMFLELLGMEMQSDVADFDYLDEIYFGNEF